MFTNLAIYYFLYLVFRFYNECLLPELINPQFGKRHLVTDIIDLPIILKEQAQKKSIFLLFLLPT